MIEIDLKLAKASRKSVDYRGQLRAVIKVIKFIDAVIDADSLFDGVIGAILDLAEFAVS